MISLFEKSEPLSESDLQHYLSLCKETAVTLGQLGIQKQAFGPNTIERIQNHSNPKRVIRTVEIYLEVLKEHLAMDSGLGAPISSAFIGN